MFLKLLSKLQPSKFNKRILGLCSIPLAFNLGQIIAYIQVFSINNLFDLLLCFGVLVGYLFFYRFVLIQVCKFLIKKQKKD